MQVRIMLLVTLFALDAARAAPVNEDQRVKVRGTFAEGRVVAETIRLKDPADRDLEIVGRVEALDDTGRIRVHGAWATIDPGELSRRARQWVRRLEPGDWIKLEGEWQSPGELRVDSVERPRRKARVDSLEGLVRDTASTDRGEALFSIGPFSVESRATTQWRGFE